MTSNDKSLVIFETEIIFNQTFGSKLHHEIASKLVEFDMTTSYSPTFER